MTIEVLVPTNDGHPQGWPLAPRLSSLSGLTIGIISNGKQGTRHFFDEFRRELLDNHNAGDVIEVVKENYSAPADLEIMDRARRWHALVAGVGD
ncbi:MAG: hypothetical protein F4Y27_07100 [Acidimicrobiaceae bacterium]|nr:hypothetical protein [Acidimicrobiaceae bacterium]MYA74426.1 hypothetical protein [Acidimicrobiaceae bacterium]MYC43435.1 hypothetical protein [Acidimicrobiaceae bacterium]MYG55839.1 hypothetical protein [Acidimicrobiaceae bacterium]MYJ97903.1 hypothetical protein [Acidimicrobiaceae bacterium]